jgi:regulator of nucleoside diphosphate kinase
MYIVTRPTQYLKQVTMLNIHTDKLILAKTDYQVLSDNLKKNKSTLNEKEFHWFSDKIKQAELRDDNDFPWEVIRLNSKVVIRDTIARLNYSYTIVLPEFADHRKCKVSVLSPIGSSLFGCRRGDNISWQTAGGKRFFTIMAVAQLPSEQ